MPYAPAVVERTTKVQEALLQAIGGKLTWLEAEEVLGWRPRTLRRWRLRYQRCGYDGLWDRRRRAPPLFWTAIDSPRPAALWPASASSTSPRTPPKARGRRLAAPAATSPSRALAPAAPLSPPLPTSRSSILSPLRARLPTRRPPTPRRRALVPA
jgi:hypothetical protein